MAVLCMNKKLAALFSVGAVGCFILGISIGHFYTTSGGGQEGSNLKRLGPAMDNKDLRLAFFNGYE